MDNWPLNRRPYTTLQHIRCESCAAPAKAIGRVELGGMGPACKFGIFTDAAPDEDDNKSYMHEGLWVVIHP